MKSFVSGWISVGVLFLLLFFMDGIPYHEVRCIARIVIPMCAAAVSVMKMIRAIRLRKAFKNGNAISCGAKIVLEFGRGRNLNRCEHAWARYTVNGKEVLGVMVCAVDQKLSEGENVSVYVNKNAPRAFAFSEKQSRDAVITYAVFGVLATALLAVEIVIFLSMELNLH